MKKKNLDMIIYFFRDFSVNEYENLSSKEQRVERHRIYSCD